MINTQQIRLADVFLIAPILIFAAFKIGIKSKLGVAVFLIGIATLLYNGLNYLKYNK